MRLLLVLAALASDAWAADCASKPDPCERNSCLLDEARAAKARGERETARNLALQSLQASAECSRKKAEPMPTVRLLRATGTVEQLPIEPPMTVADDGTAEGLPKLVTDWLKGLPAQTPVKYVMGKAFPEAGLTEVAVAEWVAGKGLVPGSLAKPIGGAAAVAGVAAGVYFDYRDLKDKAELAEGLGEHEARRFKQIQEEQRRKFKR